MDGEFIKLPYKEIGFEITRKCNLNCRHCMRGEAQNHTISKKVIDKFLGEIECTGLMILTGGEPFLEPEIIAYLFDEIIRRKVKLLGFSCVTNGTIKDKSIAESWNRLSDYIFENYSKYIDKKGTRMIGRITVSRDSYHQNDPMDAVKFYREYLNKHCIIVPEKNKKDERIYILGRAAEDEDLKQSKNAVYHVCPYKLEMDDNAILTNIMVGYDGKIMIGEDCSYEQQDRVNYGNIMEHHVYELISKGFLYEPFTQEESKIYDLIYTKIKTKNFDDNYTQEFCDGMLQYFNLVYTSRETIRTVMPFLKYEEIVEAAYDDINVNFRKSDSDAPIFRIYPFEKFERTLVQSQTNCNNLKMQALLRGNADFLLYRFNKVQIRDVPIKEW